MKPGAIAVYRCFSEQSYLLYVGIGREPLHRLRKHMDKLWFRLVARIEIEWFNQRYQAKCAETLAIHTESPAFNISENRDYPQLSASFDLNNLPTRLDIAVTTRGELHPQDPRGWDRRFQVRYGDYGGGYSPRLVAVEKIDVGLA